MKSTNYPLTLPALVEDELFLYPFMITPIFLEDSQNIQAVDEAIKKESMLCVMPSRFEDSRDYKSLYDCGVIGNVMRKVPSPDGRVKILFQGYAKVRVLKQISKNPFCVSVDLIKPLSLESAKHTALLALLRENVGNLSTVSQYFPPDLLRTIEEDIGLDKICDLVLNTVRITKDIAYSFFIETNMEKKIMDLCDLIAKEIEANKLLKEIKNKVHSKIDKVNKEYFLKEQMKQIQKELGSDSQKEEELERFCEALEAKRPFMHEDAYKELSRQIERYERTHQDNSESLLLQSYIETALEIPFEKLAHKRLEIDAVAKQLDLDHYALKKPKERIKEYFAVRKLLEKRRVRDKDGAKVILCLIGPPGVGKTSLANSVAKALGRELIRVALGGLEDISELRGHRRTYIGAMAGRIVQGLIEAKQMNPVVVLDEIDKLSKGFRGDPSAVLLEILDPEQNSKFRDYYLNFNIDLSKVIFIATANESSSIIPALRDRMEFIELSSYTPSEKFEIAKRYLLPSERKKHGLKEAEFSVSDEGLETLISDYTREAGVRALRQRFAQISRKVATKLLLGEIKSLELTPQNIGEYLHKKVFESIRLEKNDVVGKVNGLAWTAVGGDVLQIETIRIKGKGELILTGCLGDVMKESASISFSLIKKLIDEGKIKPPKALFYKKDELIYKQYNIHLHVPDGATPKDGPSAGITMCTALASIFSNKLVRKDVAMTGEIDLLGKVMPIGGLKEKLIAAFKSGIKEALIPAKNYERDLCDIPKEVRDGMKITPVSSLEEVLKITLHS